MDTHTWHEMFDHIDGAMKYTGSPSLLASGIVTERELDEMADNLPDSDTYWSWVRSRLLTSH